jgi:hypothetical protein
LNHIREKKKQTTMAANAMLFNNLQTNGKNAIVDPSHINWIAFNNGAFLEQPLGKKTMQQCKKQHVLVIVIFFLIQLGLNHQGAISLPHTFVLETCLV